MENKVRRRVGFGNPVEEIVEEDSEAPAAGAGIQPTDVKPAAASSAPEASIEEALALAGRWRRYALAASAAASVFFAIAAAGIWHARDAALGFQEVVRDRDAVRAELAQTKGYLAHTQQVETDAILLGYSFPITITSQAELIAYLTGEGKRLLDREVPVAQQAAFIAALTADPAVPRRYTAKVTVENGYEKTYVVRVTDFVYFR